MEAREWHEWSLIDESKDAVLIAAQSQSQSSEGSEQRNGYHKESSASLARPAAAARLGIAKHHLPWNSKSPCQ